MPPGTVGLRHWTVLLEDQSQIDAVRERAAAAGIEHEQRDGGLVLRDPWDNAVASKLEEHLKAGLRDHQVDGHDKQDPDDRSGDALDRRLAPVLIR